MGSGRAGRRAGRLQVSVIPAEPMAPKPVLRGWSHGVAALVSIGGLVALIVSTRNDPPKLASMIVYGLGLVLLFGVSATYHIFNWPPRVKDWLRRADHATIFVFIAATYTPLVYNVLDGWWRLGVLITIWICALAGVIGAAPFLRIPRVVVASLYVAVGWIAVGALNWSGSVSAHPPRGSGEPLRGDGLDRGGRARAAHRGSRMGGRPFDGAWRFAVFARRRGVCVPQAAPLAARLRVPRGVSPRSDHREHHVLRDRRLLRRAVLPERLEHSRRL